MPYVITRKRGVVQGKIVILIAQLALARKVIVTDPYEVPATSVAALAAWRSPAIASVCRRRNTTGHATAMVPHGRGTPTAARELRCCDTDP